MAAPGKTSVRMANPRPAAVVPLSAENQTCKRADVQNNRICAPRTHEIHFHECVDSIVCSQGAHVTCFHVCGDDYVLGDQKRLLSLLEGRAMVTPRELREARIPSVTVARLVLRGLIARVGTENALFGFRLASVAPEPFDATLVRMAEIAVLHEKAVLCLSSALRFHGLTDSFSDTLVAAVQPKSNRATVLQGVHLMQWPEKLLEVGIVEVRVCGVRARVTDLARTVADLYRPSRGGDRGRPKWQPEGDDRQRALAALAARDGDGGLGTAQSYAMELGWEDAIVTAIEAAKAMGGFNGPR